MLIIKYYIIFLVNQVLEANNEPSSCLMLYPKIIGLFTITPTVINQHIVHCQDDKQDEFYVLPSNHVKKHHQQQKG